VLSSGPVLAVGPDLLPIARARGGSDRPGPTERKPSSGGLALEEVERRHIREVLRRTGGVIEGPSGAAKILDLHPNTLRSRMKKLGVSRHAHDSQPRDIS